MIGARIKKLRLESGMTQKQLADKLFVSPQAISRWENDEVEPSISIISKMANIFDVTSDEILGLEVKEERTEQKKKPVLKKPVNSVTRPAPQRQFLAVCHQCNKPIYNGNEIVRKDGKVFCTKCNEAIMRVKKNLEIESALKRRKCSFIFGALASVVGILVTVFLWNSVLLTPGLKVFAIIYSLSLFTFVSCCILKNNFVGDVFLDIASWSIKMPGLIFTFDLDGCLWVIGMQALFAVIGFILSVGAFFLGLTVGCALSIFVYPYAIVTNIKNPGKVEF